jgi:hypothetical protein
MRRLPEIVGLVGLILLVGACRPAKRITADDLKLTERYAVQGGLAVAHHPKLLVATQATDSVARLAPAAWGTFDVEDEIFIATTKSPATAELDEYVRILHAPFETDLGGWRVATKSAASCLGVYPGIELTATFLTKDGKKRRYWSCTFLHSGHGYKVSYAVNESAAAVDVPLLRKVADATEILNPP